MKGLLRVFLFHLAALWLTTLWISGLKIAGGWRTYFLAAIILALLNILLKPVLKLLFFPVNALTLGLFTIVINGAVFYLFLQLVPEAMISAWIFPGFNQFGVSLPAQEIPFIGVLMIVSLSISVITGFFTYLVK